MNNIETFSRKGNIEKFYEIADEMTCEVSFWGERRVRFPSEDETMPLWKFVDAVYRVWAFHQHDCNEKSLPPKCELGRKLVKKTRSFYRQKNPPCPLTRLLSWLRDFFSSFKSMYSLDDVEKLTSSKINPAS